MSDEITWNTKSRPPKLVAPDHEHVAIVDDLTVTVSQSPEGYARWVVEGWLAEAHIEGFDYHPRRDLELVKANAIAAARRMAAAGIRGSISYPVTCCDRLFVTRDAADQHEGEHREADVAAVMRQVASDAEAAGAGWNAGQGDVEAAGDWPAPESLTADQVEELGREDEASEALVHFRLLIPDEIVCGADAATMPSRTMPPGITCPSCIAWMVEHRIIHDPEEAGS